MQRVIHKTGFANNVVSSSEAAIICECAKILEYHNENYSSILGMVWPKETKFERADF